MLTITEKKARVSPKGTAKKESSGIVSKETALRLENEKLKLALERIRNVDPDTCYGGISGGLKICQNIATQALN